METLISITRKDISNVVSFISNDFNIRKEDAEDIVQSVVCYLLAEQIAPKNAFSYLVSCCRNKAIDLQRYRSVEDRATYEYAHRYVSQQEDNSEVRDVVKAKALHGIQHGKAKAFADLILDGYSIEDISVLYGVQRPYISRMIRREICGS
jgi:RNA polymerase sigma factor (sigma-70 family)